MMDDTDTIAIMHISIQSIIQYYVIYFLFILFILLIPSSDFCFLLRQCFLFTQSTHSFYFNVYFCALSDLYCIQRVLAAKINEFREMCHHWTHIFSYLNIILQANKICLHFTFVHFRSQRGKLYDLEDIKAYDYLAPFAKSDYRPVATTSCGWLCVLFASKRKNAYFLI